MSTFGRRLKAYLGASLSRDRPCETDFRLLYGNLHTFKRQLKAYLFHIWRAGWTEGRSITARRCCGVFRDPGAGYKTSDLLTYLLTFFRTVKIPFDAVVAFRRFWHHLQMLRLTYLLTYWNCLISVADPAASLSPSPAYCLGLVSVSSLLHRSRDDS